MKPCAGADQGPETTGACWRSLPDESCCLVCYRANLRDTLTCNTMDHLSDPKAFWEEGTFPLKPVLKKIAFCHYNPSLIKGGCKLQFWPMNETCELNVYYLFCSNYKATEEIIAESISVDGLS